MNQEKRAWVYCRIDAPEDTHGALKGQRQQLMDYAEQMGFAVIGASEDTGSSRPRWPGLSLAVQATKEHRIHALLLKELPRFGEAANEVLLLLQKIEQSGAVIYSPLQGKIMIEKGGSQ